MRRRDAVPDDAARALGLAIAAFGPLAVAGVLVPFRDHLAGANVVLVFVVVVVLGAAIGTRWSGALTAVVAAMSFDFFFTRPYQSLKIDSGDDLVTTLLLLLIGLLVAELVVFTRRHRATSEHRQDEIARLHRVAELVAGDSDPDDVALSVQVELTSLLSLRACSFETGPSDSELPMLDRNGAIAGDHRRWVDGEYTLPAAGVQLPVYGRGHEFGRLVLHPDVSVGVSIEERLVAVALSDQLGAALAADATPH
jgi:K+-sensing histidine kinase KdpD